MKTLLPKLAAASALALTLFVLPAQASDKGELLHDANRTVENLKRDPAFATAERMMDQARAIYIVPKLVKGGFIFGAEGGDGVLVRRTAHGWANPASMAWVPLRSAFRPGLSRPNWSSSS